MTLSNKQAKVPIRIPVFIGEMLWSARDGTVVQHIWYDDGSFEEKIVPKYPVLMPTILWSLV